MEMRNKIHIFPRKEERKGKNNCINTGVNTVILISQFYLKDSFIRAVAMGVDTIVHPNILQIFSLPK